MKNLIKHSIRLTATFIAICSVVLVFQNCGSITAGVDDSGSEDGSPLDPPLDKIVSTLWKSAALPVSTTYSDVAFGNGLFVAVSGTKSDGLCGASNVAAYSADGITWTQTTLPSTECWSKVIFANGLFLATSGFANGPSVGNIAATSTDGINWTQQTLPSGRYMAAVYADGQFQALSNDGYIARSPDAVTWTKSSSQIPCFGCYYLNFFFANGLYGAQTGSQTKISYSSDGLIWNYTSMPGPAFAFCNTAAFGNGVYVAGDFKGALASSPDLVNWTVRTNPTQYPQYLGIAKIIFANGVFMAVSDSIYASTSTVASRSVENGLVSTDGINWMKFSLPAASYSSVAYGNSTWVLLHRSGVTYLK